MFLVTASLGVRAVSVGEVSEVHEQDPREAFAASARISVRQATGYVNGYVKMTWGVR